MNRQTVSPPHGHETPHLALRSPSQNFACCLIFSVDIFSRSDFVSRKNRTLSQKPGKDPSTVGHVSDRSSSILSLPHFYSCVMPLCSCVFSEIAWKLSNRMNRCCRIVRLFTYLLVLNIEDKSVSQNFVRGDCVKLTSLRWLAQCRFVLFVRFTTFLCSFVEFISFERHVFSSLAIFREFSQHRENTTVISVLRQVPERRVDFSAILANHS